MAYFFLFEGTSFQVSFSLYTGVDWRPAKRALRELKFPKRWHLSAIWRRKRRKENFRTREWNQDHNSLIQRNFSRISDHYFNSTFQSFWVFSCARPQKLLKVKILPESSFIDWLNVCRRQLLQTVPRGCMCTPILSLHCHAIKK